MPLRILLFFLLVSSLLYFEAPPSLPAFAVEVFRRARSSTSIFSRGPLTHVSARLINRSFIGLRSLGADEQCVSSLSEIDQREHQGHFDSDENLIFTSISGKIWPPSVVTEILLDHGEVIPAVTVPSLSSVIYPVKSGPPVFAHGTLGELNLCSALSEATFCQTFHSMLVASDILCSRLELQSFTVGFTNELQSLSPSHLDGEPQCHSQPGQYLRYDLSQLSCFGRGCTLENFGVLEAMNVLLQPGTMSATQDFLVETTLRSCFIAEANPFQLTHAPLETIDTLGWLSSGITCFIARFNGIFQPPSYLGEMPSSPSLIDQQLRYKLGLSQQIYCSETGCSVERLRDLGAVMFAHLDSQALLIILGYVGEWLHWPNLCDFHLLSKSPIGVAFESTLVRIYGAKLITAAVLVSFLLWTASLSIRLPVQISPVQRLYSQVESFQTTLKRNFGFLIAAMLWSIFEDCMISIKQSDPIEGFIIRDASSSFYAFRSFILYYPLTIVSGLSFFVNV